MKWPFLIKAWTDTLKDAALVGHFRPTYSLCLPSTRLDRYVRGR
ncbi:hypothetical protein [Streptomyces scopuliridis]